MPHLFISFGGKDFCVQTYEILNDAPLNILSSLYGKVRKFISCKKQSVRFNFFFF